MTRLFHSLVLTGKFRAGHQHFGSDSIPYGRMLVEQLISNQPERFGLLDKRVNYSTFQTMPFVASLRNTANGTLKSDPCHGAREPTRQT
jgi:hypothetical protein